MSLLDLYKENESYTLLENYVITGAEELEDLFEELLFEATKVPIDETHEKVHFYKIDKMYDKSVAKHQNKKAQIETKVRDFISFKKENPTSPFSTADAPFKLNTKMWHYHVTRDLSLVYHMANNNGIINFILFGVYSHDEIGSSKTIGNSGIFVKIGKIINEL